MCLQLSQASLVPRYLVNDNRVAILDKDSKLHYAEVGIVRQEGANVVIESGLVDGDKLIISALDYPLDGMKLALVGEELEESTEEQSEAQIASVKD